MNHKATKHTKTTDSIAQFMIDTFTLNFVSFVSLW